MEDEDDSNEVEEETDEEDSEQGADEEEEGRRISVDLGDESDREVEIEEVFPVEPEHFEGVSAEDLILHSDESTVTNLESGLKNVPSGTGNSEEDNWEYAVSNSYESGGNYENSQGYEVNQAKEVVNNLDTGVQLIQPTLRSRDSRDLVSKDRGLESFEKAQREYQESKVDDDSAMPKRKRLRDRDITKTF